MIGGVAQFDQHDERAMFFVVYNSAYASSILRRSLDCYEYVVYLR